MKSAASSLSAKIALFAVLLAAALPAPLVMASGIAEVQVTVKDEVGTPVAGVEIVLTPLDINEKPLSAAPWTSKTGKKGTTLFPFLPYNAQGEGRYDVSIKHEGFYIHEFHIISRQVPPGSGQGTLIQDDTATIGPTQKPQPMMAKVQGKVEVTLTIAKIPATPGFGAPGKGAAAAAGAAAPAAAPADANPNTLTHARELMAAGKYDEAEAILKKMKETKPSVDLDFEFARLYHLEEKNAEEKTALRAVLAQDASYPRAHYELGRMAYEEGHPEVALTEFEAEYKAHPDDAQSAGALASLYAEMGRTADAIRVYEAMVAADPTNTDALVSLDGLYTALGDTKKSEEAYKKVLALNPTGADQVYYKVGVTLSRNPDMSASDRARATAAFQKATELNPNNAKAQRELGYALVGLGKMDEAKPHFQSYLKLDPGAKDAATIKQFLQGT